MNEIITYDVKPFVYLTEEGTVEKAYEIHNLKIDDYLNGYHLTIFLHGCYYSVDYVDDTLFIAWDPVYAPPNRFAIENSTLLMQEAVKQLEEILSECKDSMEDYVKDKRARYNKI